MRKTSIVIINDSRAMRLFLEDVIKSYADCQIIGSYFDGAIALESLKSKKPDIIILDLEMPNMDGLTFLEKLTDGEIPPTIVVSNYAKDGSEMINQVMMLGAVDSLMPPPSNTKEEFEKFKNILHHKITKAYLKSSKFSLKCS